MYTNSQDEVIVQNLDNEVFLGLQEWTRLTLPLQKLNGRLAAPTLVPTIQRKEEINFFTR
jgi:hypothetical protein